MLFDAILRKECGDLSAHELCTIVGDYRLRATESVNDVLPDEPLNINFLGEVISGNNHHLLLGRCRRHMSYQVNGPLHEWPWTILRMVFLSRQARDQLIVLASITSSSILRGVLAHGRPEIVYAKSLLDKRSAPQRDFHIRRHVF